MAVAKTLSEYKGELKDLMNDVWAGIEKMGEKLVRASKDLSHHDYEELRKWLRTWWTDADLKAAEAVGNGELDPRLFPHGTRNSKVMSLLRTEQDRLLSSEKFEVYNNFGGVDVRTWAEMTPDQRNRLLGDKGGSIHTLAAQRKPGTRKDTVAQYETASFYQGILRLNGGRSRGEIHVGTIANTMPRDELGQLCEKLGELLAGKE